MTAKYSRQKLSDSIVVDSIVSLHFFEYSKDFTYEGESHPFWEFVYVDNGTLDIIAGEDRKTLFKNQIVFHKPNEFHNIICNGKDAANTVIVSFYTKSESACFLEGFIKKLNKYEMNKLAEIMNVGIKVFEGPYNVPFGVKLTKKSNPPFASEQELKNLLELFLINLIRGSSLSDGKGLLLETNVDSTLEGIIEFLEDNICNTYALEDLTKRFLISKSKLRQLFNEGLNTPPIEYFNKLKIDYAKKMLREEKYSVTEISSYLGFASVSYFSRYFKRLTRMSPKAYVESVKAKLGLADEVMPE